MFQSFSRKAKSNARQLQVELLEGRDMPSTLAALPAPVLGAEWPPPPTAQMMTVSRTIGEEIPTLVQGNQHALTPNRSSGDEIPMLVGGGHELATAVHQMTIGEEIPSLVSINLMPIGEEIPQ